MLSSSLPTEATAKAATAASRGLVMLARTICRWHAGSLAVVVTVSLGSFDESYRSKPNGCVSIIRGQHDELLEAVNGRCAIKARERKKAVRVAWCRRHADI